MLAELDYDNAEKCFYTRGNELISQERDGKKSYYVYDGHGSVRALADESGKVTDKYVYDAFGNLISSVGSTKNDFLFAGEQFDPVTGLYYLRARYMNPSVGTFISMDSYEGSIDDPVSLHKYLYCNSDPVNNYDPSGYNTLAELETTTGMQGALNQIAMPNPKALMDLVGGIFEVVRDTASSVVEGIEMGLEGPELAMHIASGLLTSLVTNFSCMLTSLGPFGYVLMGIAAVVIGVIAVVSFAEGNTEMGLAQVANLVSIVFSIFNPSCFTGETEVYTSDGETIDTTTNHPFYVEDKGWVAPVILKLVTLLLLLMVMRLKLLTLSLKSLQILSWFTTLRLRISILTLLVSMGCWCIIILVKMGKKSIAKPHGKMAKQSELI